MDIRKIKKLIDMIGESDVAEIEIHEGEESVRISRNSSVQMAPQAYMAPAPMLQAAPAAQAAMVPDAAPKKGEADALSGLRWSVLSIVPQRQDQRSSSKSDSALKSAIRFASSRP